MTNQSRRSNMATEYEVVQRQRMEYVALIHRWGLGLISVAAVVLSVFLLLANGKYWYIGLALVFFILYLWRRQAHFFDDRVKELYYTIVRLEEKLGFNFYREYLERRALKPKYCKKFKKSQGKLSDFIHKYYHERGIDIFGERGHRSHDALVVAIGIMIAIGIFYLSFC